MKRLTCLIISLIFFSCFSCNKNDSLRPMPESAKAYLYAYTQGTISRTSSIDIQFAGLVATAEDIGTKIPAALVQLKPNAPGEWQWADRQTMRFTPDPALDFATTYTVQVSLKDLFDNVPSEASLFEFNVQTREPYVSLSVDGLETPNLGERTQQVLRGELYTSDYLDSETATTLLVAEQGSRKLDLTWSHDAEGIVHYFTAKGIERGNDPSAIYLNLIGAALGSDQRDRKEVEVPALGDFKVTSVEPQNGQEPVVDIYFSDPLNENQDFTGLVSISNSNDQFRYQAEGHRLRVFLNSAITGEQQVSVYTGVRNHFREKLPRSSVWSVTFTAAEPQVRLVGHGNILPTSSNLIVPFEAIGLHSVEVEIFKIYHNNILQFLQNNRFNGQSGLEQVGQVILRKEVPLRNINPGASQQEWSRYALDLESFFEADPQAFYQVRIGFQRSHSLYRCGDEQQFTFQEEGYGSDSENLLNSWYGLEGYYNEYRWRQREDPCYPAYYNSDRFVKRTILTSNLGLIVKGEGSNNYRAIVTSLQTTQAVSGATLEFYNFQQQLLGSATSDGDGMVSIDLPEKAFFAVARNGDDQTYLRLHDNEVLSTNRFDVAGTQVQDGLKGFLYGERGVWRPGDSIFLNFVLEDEMGTLPPDYPVRFEFRDPRGQVVENRNGVLPVGQVYPLHLKTNADATTGLWQVKVVAGEASFRKNIRIETVKPNRIKMEIVGGDEPLRLAGGRKQLTLDAAWLHGAPAANLSANVEASIRTDNSGFASFKNYTFLDREKPGELVRSKVLFNDQLNAQGSGSFYLDLPAQQQAAGPLSVRLRNRVIERGGNFSTEFRNLTVHPFDYYAGLQLPKNRYGSPQLNVGEPAVIELAGVNYKGQAAANRSLSASVFRVEWRWWWDDEDGNGRYVCNRTSEPINTTTVTTDAQGRAAWTLELERWGRYLVKVCDQGTNHCSSGYVYAGSPWYNEGTFSEEASMLTFQSDKEQYALGDDVSITFPAGEGGRALLSLETGDGVLEEIWIDTKAGDNTYTFATTPEMAPSVYAFLTVLQPYDQEKNDLPIRSYGVIPIVVEDPATRLEPEIKVAAELKPEEEFTVEVKEAKGKAMTYTLAVVDEGLLSLTNFGTPNPHDAFFAREALGVKSWDLFNYVLGKESVAMNQVLSIGGDAAGDGPREASRANRFEPVVMHLGPFQLDRRGRASHKLRMPNYVGAVRVMVVASGDQAYGAAEESVPVRKPLMVLGTLPRVLSVGDQLQVPVNVFAMQDGLGEVSVRVTEQSGLVDVVNANKSTRFSSAGDGVLYFPVNVGDRTGVARFTISAEGGGERATQEIEIDVRNPNPFQTQTEDFVLNAGEEKNLQFEPLGAAGGRTATLEMTNLPPLNLEKRLSYLIGYPYGCIEQTTSAAFPQLHLAQFIQLDDKKREEVRENIEAAINRLQRFQRSDGGFSYWPGGNDVSSWNTSYVGHFLVAAKAAGYAVPDGMIRTWKQFQKAAARAWNGRFADYGWYNSRSFELDQAYRLYTLALAEQPALGAMNRLRERDGLSRNVRWQLGAAYALAGQTKAATELTRSLGTDIENYRELDYTFGSTLRDRSMMLNALLTIGEDQQSATLARQIADELRSREWLSTQEIAYALLAFSKYLNDDETLSKSYTFRFQQNQASAIDVGADHPYMQLNLRDQAGPIVVSNTGQQKLFGSLIRTGQPLPGQEQAASKQLLLEVRYLDTQGEPLDVTELEQGTNFTAEVQVSHPGNLSYTYRQMALEQIFPSGWEIVNARFEEMGRNDDSDYTYRDYRDDRVHTFFHLYPGKSKTFRVGLTATYNGRFYLPAMACETMYSNAVSANTAGYWVEVKSEDLE
ncbi:MAG: MG2 domain-containing protein [Bacteroidota bacterium]